MIEPLEEGDSYRVEAYVPEPTPAQMREAPRIVPNALLGYTELQQLPPAYRAWAADLILAGSAPH